MKNNYLLLTLVLIYCIIWSIIPVLINFNLDYDLVQQYVLGNQFRLGYNHPPLSFWLPAIYFKFFPKTDFYYYLFAQVNVFLAFLALWLLAKEFVSSKLQLLVVIFLMLIPFFNTFASKYNANSAMYFPWAFSIYFAYLSLFKNKLYHWIALGFFCALTLVTKYFAVILLVSIFSLIFIKQGRKKLKEFGPYLALIIFLLVLSPHLYWTFSSQSVLNYATQRIFVDASSSGRLEGLRFLITFPMYLLFIYISLLICLKKIPLLKILTYKKDDLRQLFLWHITIFPWLLIAVISMLFNISFTGIWAMPIWLSAPLIIVYQLKQVDLKKINNLIKVSISLVIFFAILVLTYQFFTKKIHPEYSYPSKLVLKYVKENWNEQELPPIQSIATISWPLLENIKFYENDTDITDFSASNLQSINNQSALICDNKDSNCVSQLKLIAQNLSLNIQTIQIDEAEYLFSRTQKMTLSVLFINNKYEYKK